MSFIHDYESSRHSQPLFWFGFVGLGVILTVLILFWFGGRGQGLFKKNIEAVAAPAQHSPASLIASYRQEIDALKISLGTAKDVNTLLTRAETGLFAIRVPKELLDDHFQVLLLVREWQGKKATASLSEVHTTLVEKMSALETKAATL